MCVVSMVMDHYWEKWTPSVPVLPGPHLIPREIPTQAEIDEFRRLLERAREYDRRHNEPDCELEEKRKRLQALADELGIDISFVEGGEVKCH